MSRDWCCILNHIIHVAASVSVKKQSPWWPALDVEGDELDWRCILIRNIMLLLLCMLFLINQAHLDGRPLMWKGLSLTGAAAILRPEHNVAALMYAVSCESSSPWRPALDVEGDELDWRCSNLRPEHNVAAFMYSVACESSSPWWPALDVEGDELDWRCQLHAGGHLLAVLQQPQHRLLVGVLLQYKEDNGDCHWR
jgi:hypothetical protein